MERDNFQCQRCKDSESTLNVHHRLYIKGLDPWEYGPLTLVTLCEPCHADESMVSESVWRLLVTLFPKYGDQTDSSKLDAISACARIGSEDGISSDDAASFAFCVGWMCHLFSQKTPESIAEIDRITRAFAVLFNASQEGAQ